MPRFGADYSVPVLDGTERNQLRCTGPVFHITTPGPRRQPSLAGHRQTYGAVLWDMDQLTEGDRLYLQTANGWWVYETRKVHIVDPSDTDVLNPNPMDPATAEPDGQWLTLTTCHPPYTVLQRMITHAEFVEFVPLADGPPAELAGSDTAAVHTPEINDHTLTTHPILEA